MTRSSLTVIKVGGSLFDWPELPRRLTEMIDAHQAAHREEHLVLIAGGGPAADVVRALDRVHDLGDRRAHRLALHVMDLTAIILAELLHMGLSSSRASMRSARCLLQRLDPHPGSTLDPR